jgi:hypothetical protein
MSSRDTREDDVLLVKFSYDLLGGQFLRIARKPYSGWYCNVGSWSESENVTSIRQLASLMMSLSMILKNSSSSSMKQISGVPCTDYKSSTSSFGKRISRIHNTQHSSVPWSHRLAI